MAIRSLGLKLLAILFASLVGLGAVSAKDGDPAWANLPYRYIVIDQDLRDVLTEFGRNIKVPTKVSQAVGTHRIRGAVSAKHNQTALIFLQNLCESYGLVWYFDGATLFVATDDEVKTELVKLNDVKSAAVLRRMVDLGLSSSRFTVRGTEDGNMLSVSGPPAYRSQIKELVMKLQGDYHERPAREIKLDDDPKVRVFKGGSGS
jgi:type III secretion protein C